jgi:23S rRNA pseudouridine955/2504/2580 synthase/23S rRNA pseudouridine1911/1915/1917 synthase
VIDAGGAGIRLDVWLARRFTYHSRTKWRELVESGAVLLNGGKTRASRVLSAGETVLYITDGLQEPAVDPAVETVYEDDVLLIVNKTGSLPCHPAGPFFKNTLWYILREKMDGVHIVNRLDRETSGLVIVCKKAEDAKRMSALFAGAKVKKTYIAGVYGAFTEEIRAEGLLAADAESPVMKKRRFIMRGGEAPPGAESCLTVLKPLKPGGAVSLVTAEPATGRLHQIRATLQSLGWPLVGDKLYGPDPSIYLRFVKDAMTQSDIDTLILPRQALHASKLEFEHPAARTKMTFESPVPPGMAPLFL